MSPSDKQQLIRDLMADHKAFIEKTMSRYNDYPVVPDSVHEYTEMYLTKLEAIVRAAN